MTGVILAAGRGARLNSDGQEAGLPKCLVRLAGETLLARNVRLLREAGIGDLVVVVGCEADMVRASCPQVQFVENTRFAETNSLYSLWLARHRLTDGFLVMNCDVIVHPQLLRDLLTARHEDAALLAYAGVDAAYGEEEMKVRVQRGLVLEMSKTLPPREADAENVGIARFGASGARVFVEEMNALIEAGQHRAWVPRAFTEFARRRPLHGIGTRGLPWIEIDFPEDYQHALEVVLPAIEGEAPLQTAPVRAPAARYA